MRVPVVSKDGKPLMPTKPAKARKMIEGGVAKKCWSKTGVFYIQMLIYVGEEVQDIALAIDPGSKYDGYAVSGGKDVALKTMAVMPQKVHKKVAERRQLRRSRRYRNKRRGKCRFNNRKRKEGWIAPSQLAKVQFRIKIVRDLAKIFPLNFIVVEDVRFNHYKKRWGKYFSTVEIGKTMLYKELEHHGKMIKYQGWQTAEARKYWGIKKSSAKDALIPESHANDALAMLCEIFGNNVDNSCIFTVWRRLEFSRRSLHRQNYQKGGIRQRFGGTTNGYCLHKGDLVSGEQGDKHFRGWVCGLPTDKTKAIAIADVTGKRLAQCSERKVKLIRRATGITSDSRYIPKLPVVIPTVQEPVTIQAPIQLEFIFGNSSPLRYSEQALIRRIRRGILA